MRELTVQIERLEPLRVASVAVKSESPEGEAIDALLNWARPQGLLDGTFRFFGYDNCQPYPNHTYTTWLSVGQDVQPSGAITIKDFAGGLYAVMEVQGVEQISPGWKQLAQWCAAHGYRLGKPPCLEEPVDILGQYSLSERHFKLYHSIEE